MNAQEIKSMAIDATRDIFVRFNYKITKSRIYKNYEDFVSQIRIMCGYEFIFENGQKIDGGMLKLEGGIIFEEICKILNIAETDNTNDTGKFNFTLGGRWIENQEDRHSPRWEIYSKEDFEKYRVGIRRFLIKALQTDESYADPYNYLRTVFALKSEKPSPMDGLDERVVALYRVGNKFGVRDEWFLIAIEKWHEEYRADFKKLQAQLTQTKKPIPSWYKPPRTRKVSIFKAMSQLESFDFQVGLSNGKLRKLACALGEPEERWAIINPRTGEKTATTLTDDLFLSKPQLR
jgi:hypothetical protein